MPCLQAVVQPLMGKKSPIPQVERRAITAKRFLNYFFPLTYYKVHKPMTHAKADNTSRFEAIARLQTRTTGCKRGIT